MNLSNSTKLLASQYIWIFNLGLLGENKFTKPVYATILGIIKKPIQSKLRENIEISIDILRVIKKIHKMLWESLQNY